MKNERYLLLRLTLLISDITILNLCFCSANLFVLHLYGHLPAHIDWSELALFNVIWMFFASIFRLYTNKTLDQIETIYRSTWRTLVAHVMLYAGACYLLMQQYLNYSFFWFCFGSIIILMALNRLLLTYITEFILKTVVAKRNVLIVGDHTEGKKLANYFNNNKRFYSLAGIFYDETTDNTNELYKGKLEACVDFAAQNEVNYIYSTVLPEENKNLLTLQEEAENKCIHVFFVAKEKELIGNNYYHINYIDKMPVLSLRADPLLKQKNILRKRIFDIVFSTAVIIFVMSWLTPLIAILIKLGSRGPVFFVQQRSGKDNRSFRCFKFRSMRVNTSSDTEQATRNDKRITPIGAFLRKTSLDEFPQFFNVFLGNMSIVGPRPHMLNHTEQYSALINKYLVRHYLKPGITGWAQVNGYRGETLNVSLMEKRVAYDIAYMENWSQMQDVKIVFMTIINILKGEENAR